MPVGDVRQLVGRNVGGGFHVLGFSVGPGERCVELLDDLRARGLEGVELFVSDESGAIRHGLEQVYPAVAWTKRWKSLAPWAAQQFMDRLTDSLSFYGLPSAWWRRSRTNNP